MFAAGTLAGFAAIVVSSAIRPGPESWRRLVRIDRRCVTSARQRTFDKLIRRLSSTATSEPYPRKPPEVSRSTCQNTRDSRRILCTRYVAMQDQLIAFRLTRHELERLGPERPLDRNKSYICARRNRHMREHDFLATARFRPVS